MGVKSLGYLGFESQRRDEWRAFMTDVVGLMDVTEGDGELRFRMDDHAWRFAVQDGDAEDLAYVGLDAGSLADLDALAEQLTASGYSAERNDELAAQRGVNQLIVSTDPDGLQVELYCGKTELGEVPFASPAGVSGFLQSMAFRCRKPTADFVSRGDVTGVLQPPPGRADGRSRRRQRV